MRCLNCDSTNVELIESQCPTGVVGPAGQSESWFERGYHCLDCGAVEDTVVPAERRLVLNAYFRMGHDPGGFRLWWRALTGSDDTLENTCLMRLTGRFSRRLRAHAKAHGIPVIDCPAGERKHELADEYLG